ncbi:MAG: hypothetical protein NTV93_09210 [Verrucomicrobia bacterium]|nr:hypothetical protein [Verrucomicrobiota bacterium]
MKTAQIILTCLACASIAVGTANAQSAPEPVLNIQAGDGVAVDKSSKHREIPPLPAGESNKSVVLPNERAIEIPYAEGDPLFSTEEFTWILRAKFANPGVPNLFTPVMGRWFFATNDRSAALIIDPERHMKYNLSPDGTTAGILTEGCAATLEDNMWRIFVLRWKQGEIASLSIYGNDGTQLETHKTAQKLILPSIKKVAQPFLVGAPANYGMEIKSVKVFDRALGDEELATDLLTK